MWPLGSLVRFLLLSLVLTATAPTVGSQHTILNVTKSRERFHNGRKAHQSQSAAQSPLLSEHHQPHPSHHIFPYLSAAKHLLSLDAPLRHKRLALLASLQGVGQSPPGPESWHPELSLSADNITAQLKKLGQHMLCRQDLTLPTSFPLDRKYLIAANLKNNGLLLPHWTLQLLKAILSHLTTRTRRAKSGQIMVSIFESGSEDYSPQYVAVLEVLLNALGIPRNIIASGNLRRDQKERIAFLSTVRNAAIAPLHSHPHFPGGFPADRIIFINDVWFCHGDIIRLTQYHSADIACGMDFDRAARRRHLLRSMRHLLSFGNPPFGLGASESHTFTHALPKRGAAVQDRGAAVQQGETDQDGKEEGVVRQGRKTLEGAPSAKGGGEGGGDGKLEGNKQLDKSLLKQYPLEELVRMKKEVEKELTELEFGRPTSGVDSEQDLVDAEELQRFNLSLRSMITLALLPLGQKGSESEGEEEGDLGSWRKGILGEGAGKSLEEKGKGKEREGKGGASDESALKGVGAGDFEREGDDGNVVGDGEPTTSARRKLLRETPYLGFYDTWVARAIDGTRFEKPFPVTSHGPSAKALEEGLPFPVVCCWDGMAVLNAAPFRQHGLKFRNYVPDECQASECSLMCDDFWRLGYQKALVDPSIRQTYVPWTPELYYDNLLGHHIPLRSWENLTFHQTQHKFTRPLPQQPPASHPSSRHVSQQATGSGEGEGPLAGRARGGRRGLLRVSWWKAVLGWGDDTKSMNGSSSQQETLIPSMSTANPSSNLDTGRVPQVTPGLALSNSASSSPSSAQPASSNSNSASPSSSLSALASVPTASFPQPSLISPNSTERWQALKSAFDFLRHQNQGSAAGGTGLGGSSSADSKGSFGSQHPQNLNPVLIPNDIQIQSQPLMPGHDQSQVEGDTGGGGNQREGLQGSENGEGWASPPMVDVVARFWEGVSPPQSQVCCHKGDKSEWVDFTKCMPLPFMSPNHTATALQRQATGL